MRSLTKARWLVAATFGLTILASGCVHPLGPGFAFVDRSTDIRAVPPANPLRVTVKDRLENIGNLTLNSIDVRLDPAALKSANLRLTVDGREITPEPTPGLPAQEVRLKLSPSWKREQSLHLVTEWAVPADAAESSGAGVSPLAFYAADPAFLPFWQTPPGPFSVGDARPPKETLTIFAPADFRVLAPGKPLRVRREASGTQSSFKIVAARDPQPFVVAGRYQVRTAATPDGSVIFWTFVALDPRQAQAAAMRLAASYKALSAFFGRTRQRVIHIAQIPDGSPQASSELEATSFPGGALLDSRTLAQGIATEPVLELCEYALSQTWFGWQVPPQAGEEAMMQRGMAWFGVVAAAEARAAAQTPTASVTPGPAPAGDARRRIVARLLDDFDREERAASSKLASTAVGAVFLTDAQQAADTYKDALFFVALEDLCGRANLRTALQEILRARSGADASEDDLRAALEDVTHRNLASEFHKWQDHPDVPQDFRARYANSPGAAQLR